jgi:hypothetical protein
MDSWWNSACQGGPPQVRDADYDLQASQKIVIITADWLKHFRKSRISPCSEKYRFKVFPIVRFGFQAYQRISGEILQLREGTHNFVTLF